jgi:outer membrane protein assembly factor BamB
MGVQSDSPDAVAYQVDIGHTGWQRSGAIASPLKQRWSVDLKAPASYPIITGGAVYATTSESGGGHLVALDLKTGNDIWPPIAFSGDYFTAAAYDAGVLFVIQSDGLLTAINASDGSKKWAKQMPGQYAFSSPPTAGGGFVFVGGAGSGGTVYAVDQATGAVAWTAPVMNGDNSSPALGPEGVFVSYACNQAYGFSAHGSSLWHHDGPCEGGGGATPVLYDGQVYVRDFMGNLQLSAASGKEVGSFKADTTPAFAGKRGYFTAGGVLEARELATMQVAWTFSGDADLASPPIVVDAAHNEPQAHPRVVYVASAKGALYAVDDATGAELSNATLGADFAKSDIAAMGASNGVLVVPAGTSLVAY